MEPSARGPARFLLGTFAITLAWAGLFLTVDPGVQGVDAEELVARAGDARAFFTVDVVFVVLYAVAGPIALWTYGRTLAGDSNGHVLAWLAIGVVGLAAGGAFDLAENVLLLAASSHVHEFAVDLAHALAYPKYAFGGAGFLVALIALPGAVRRARGR